MENYYVETVRMYNGFPITTTCNYQEHFGKKETAGLHLHEKIEMIYCVEGGYCATLSGNECTFTKGDLLIINSNEKHKMSNICDESALWVIQFDPEILYNPSLSVFETRYVTPFIDSGSKHPRVVKREYIESSPVGNLLEKIIDEHKNRSFGYELAIRGYICEMFMLILRHWNDSGVGIQQENMICDKMMRSLNDVIKYVGENYAEDVSVSSVAEMCNMSYSYFSRQFKRIMDVSFTDYLNFVRVSKAEHLLCNTDKNVTEVAVSVGYSDSAYFIQKFKQIKGISPNKFKKFHLVQSDK